MKIVWPSKKWPNADFALVRPLMHLYDAIGQFNFKQINRSSTIEHQYCKPKRVAFTDPIL